MRSLAEATLSLCDRSAIVDAAAALRGLPEISRVVLFGSKATGKDGLYSDIDLLVLTSVEPDTALRDRVSDELFEINLEHDVLLTAVVLSEQDWESGLTSRTQIRREVEEQGCVV